MSTFHNEAAMAHGAGNPNWVVEFTNAEGTDLIRIEVGATDRQQAINKASYRLNTADLSKPALALYFRGAKQL
jgi:hypothetical protein